MGTGEENAGGGCNGMCEGGRGNKRLEETKQWKQERRGNI